MTSDQVSLSMDDATIVWSIVEKQLDLFCQAWEQADHPPEIGDFVGDQVPAVRRLILMDLVKVDLEFRGAKADWVKPVEYYVDAWPELASDQGVPAELLYEDIHQRRVRGEEPDVQQYAQRFPQSADALRRLLGINGAEASTALSHSRLQHLAYRVGDTIDDFELRVELGRGAFGVVFLATQKSMQRMVALKISANRGTEAQVLAQLDHPHIVRVYDRRVLADQDLQLFYMQYVRGGTLCDALKYVRARDPSKWCGRLLLEAIDHALDDHGEVIPAPTPARIALSHSDWLKSTCDMGIQLASALDYAHQKNTLHRDIKPANVLLTVDGVAKLADFNISCSSKVAGASPAAYFGGSLAYMSPEQLEAYNPRHDRQPASLDGRSDIYSTGVVVWEMLTGSRPFGDEQLVDTWERTLQQMTARRRAGLSRADWDSLPSNCPSALRQFLKRALDPLPENRFAVAADSIRLLRIAGSSSEQTPPMQRLLIHFARRHPYQVMCLAGVLPHVLAALFVFYYNSVQAVPASSKNAFMFAQSMINGVFFPLGILATIRLTWPLARALKAVRRGEAVDADLQVLARNRSLSLGRVVLMIGIVLWTLAGIVYPVVLVRDIGNSDLADFFFSHLIGGLIAGPYPFFMITYVGLTAWYPPFLETNVDDDGVEANLLSTTSRTARGVEMLAASLPMLAVVLMAFFPGTEDKRELHRRMLGALSTYSLLGFGFLYWISGSIRRRIERLQSVLQPNEPSTRMK